MGYIVVGFLTPVLLLEGLLLHNGGLGDGDGVEDSSLLLISLAMIDRLV